uniref:Serine protease n=1 Tax=Oryza meridionalis TaxID=40149 RepID=A0A0E0EFU7_9ORYZ
MSEASSPNGKERRASFVIVSRCMAMAPLLLILLVFMPCQTMLFTFDRVTSSPPLFSIISSWWMNPLPQHSSSTPIQAAARLDQRHKQFRGNGFVVFGSGNTGLILTCEHNLPKTESNGTVAVVVVGFHTGVRFDARVVYVDAGRDLALLRADTFSVPCTPLRFWEDGDVVSGIDVVLLAFFTMKYGQVLVEPGTFPGKILSEPVWDEETDSGEIRSDYTSESGTSGAPVFLQRVNKVVGVNSGALGGTVKTAISVRTIHAALRQWLQPGDGIDGQEELIRLEVRDKLC